MVATKKTPRNSPVWVDVGPVLHCRSEALGEHVRLLCASKAEVYGWVSLKDWEALSSAVMAELSLLWEPVKKGAVAYKYSGNGWLPTKTIADGWHFAHAWKEAKAQFVWQEGDWQRYLPALEKFLTALPPGGVGPRKDKAPVAVNQIAGDAPMVVVAQRLPDFDAEGAVAALQKHGKSEQEARTLIESLRKDHDDEYLGKVFARLPDKTPANWWSYLRGMLNMAAEEDVAIKAARKRRSSLVI